jgi:transcription elongation factor Elf1
VPKKTAIGAKEPNPKKTFLCPVCKKEGIVTTQFAYESLVVHLKKEHKA